MNKQTKLIYTRALFFLLFFIIFGLIIINEKKEVLIYPRIKNKIEIYLKENYHENFNIEKIKYQNSKFTAKVTSKSNKNHYFYITYSKRKIEDTYKNDYLKGKTLLKSTEKEIQKSIEDLTKTKYNIEINSSLTDFTKLVKDKILKEENLISLKIYIIKKEIMINKWNSEEITKSIISIINNLSSKKINPKSYKIIITNKNDITESIEISNLTESFLNNPYKEIIIDDIIKDNNSKILIENKILYKYLN